MSGTAIIVAMESELLPFVHGWTRRSIAAARQDLPCYQNGDVIAVAGGIGCARAEFAARTLVEKFHPATLISAGLAGALIRSLKAGNIVLPSVVIDAVSGEEYRCDAAEGQVSGGVLVSTGEVAGSGSKTKLVENFHALVVDMEAAGVARVAREFALGFRCVKAISDEFDFRMPPVGRFIDSQGRMQSGKFALWVTIRPQYWPATMRLAGNTRRATAALSCWLQKNLPGIISTPVATLQPAERLRN